MSRTAQEPNPRVCEFSRTCPDWPWGQPDSCTMVTGFFPGVKRLWHDIDDPHLSVAEVIERIELYIYPHSRSLWPVLGWTVPILPPCAVLVVLCAITSSVGCSEIYMCVYHGYHSCILAVTFFLFFVPLLVIVFCRCFHYYDVLSLSAIHYLLQYIILSTSCILLYSLFWVIPHHLNFMCRRFGTLCLFYRRRCWKRESLHPL